MNRVDRVRLSGALADERTRFVAEHPQSEELARAAADHLLAGVPMAWMQRWPGSFPIAVDHAEGGRLTDVDGHEYVDLCLGTSSVWPVTSRDGPRCSCTTSAITAPSTRRSSPTITARSSRDTARSAPAPTRPPRRSWCRSTTSTPWSGRSLSATWRACSPSRPSFTPHHTDADVDRHTEVFGEALDALLVPNRVRRPTNG